MVWFVREVFHAGSGVKDGSDRVGGEAGRSERRQLLRWDDEAVVEEDWDENEEEEESGWVSFLVLMTEWDIVEEEELDWGGN